MTIDSRWITRVVATILCCILIAGCSNGQSSLGNPYSGSLRDLIPKKVGKFTLLNISDPLPHSAKKRMGPFTEAYLNTYTSSNGKGIQMLTANYPSAQDANERLAVIKKSGCAYGGSKQIREDTLKKKGTFTVGNRLVEECVNPDSRLGGNTVIWTNGSVLFGISMAQTGDENTFPTIDEILGFEREFPY